MTGKLELLCGPSGVGKSSSFGKKKAYTYTTRPQREKEINGIDRRFVTEAEFDELKTKGDILIDYKYGEFSYGFSKEIVDVLQSGESISEQVVPYEAAMKIVDTFKQYGTVKKNLFLTNISILKDKLLKREIIDFIVRGRDAESTVQKYLSHLNEFDSVKYVPLEFYNSTPALKKILLEDKKLLSLFLQDIKKYGVVLDMPRLPLFGLQDEKNIEMLFLFNPKLYEHTVELTESIIKECLLKTEKNIPKNMKREKSDKIKIFDDIIGITSIYMELDDFKGAGEFNVKKIVELIEKDPFSEKTRSSDPLIRQIASDCISEYSDESLETYVKYVYDSEYLPIGMKSFIKKNGVNGLLADIAKSHKLTELVSEISSLYIHSTIIPDLRRFIKKNDDTKENLEGLSFLNITAAVLDEGYLEVAEKYLPPRIASKNISHSTFNAMNMIKKKDMEKRIQKYDLFLGIYSINHLMKSLDRYLWSYNLRALFSDDVKGTEKGRLSTIYDACMSQSTRKNTIERKYFAFVTENLFHQLNYNENFLRENPGTNRLAMNFPPVITKTDNMTVYFLLHKDIMLRKTQKEHAKNVKKEFEEFLRY